MAETVKVEEEVADEVVQPTAAVSAGALTIDELEALLDAKRKELGQGIRQEGGMVAPPGKAPAGFIWLYNRGPLEFEWQHNSVVYKLDGHSFGLFPRRVAEHGKTRSLLTVDTLSNTATHQLALPEDKTYGKPLKRIERVEVIDRRANANPAQLMTDQKTRVAVLTVEGAEADLNPRAVGEFSELT
jgi:hypothetical protein